MLLIIFLLAFTIIGFIVYECDSKYWHTEGLEIIGAVFGLTGCIVTIISGIILIIALCDAPARQASYEEEYNKLVQKIEHIDSFNYGEVVEEVNKWNETYRENTYARKSPWINWYYTIDTSTTSLIDLGELENERKNKSSVSLSE